MYVFYAFLRAFSIFITPYGSILVQLLREQPFLYGKKTIPFFDTGWYTRPTSMVLYILVVDPSKRIWVSINTAA